MRCRSASRPRSTEEPRHLDLRWAHDETDLDLRNSGFRSAVADLAAPMHGVAKDELEGEDIRQHRRARRLARGGVAVLALLLVVAVIAGGLAVSNAGRAGRNADRAEREATVARARGLAGQAVARANSAPDLALLLALEGNRADDSAESRSALLTVLQRTANVKRLLSAPPGEVVSGLSEDGRIVASSDLTGTVHLVAFPSPRASLSFVTHQRGPVSVFFSPDGRLVATTSEDATVRLWDQEGPARVADLARALRARPRRGLQPRRQTIDHGGLGRIQLSLGHRDRATVARACRASFSPRTSTSCSVRTEPASRTRGSPREFFDISADTTVIERTFHGPVTSGNVALSADGTLLATGSPGAVEVWDVASDRLRVVLRVGTLTGALRFSPDGSTLAIGQGDGATTLWDISTGQMIGTPLVGLRGAVTRVAFGADGSLVSASASGAAIWDLKRSALSRATKITPLIEGSVVLPAVAFSPDGRQLATFDGQLAFFDPSTVQHRGALISTPSTGYFVLGDLAFPGLAFGANGHAYTAAGTAVSDIDTRSRTVSRAALRIAPSGDRPRSECRRSPLGDR